ncbi:hypothetical protein CsSME_00005492 [Camellia sinensis var. sinensis]
MDFCSVFILDSPIDKDKPPKSFILIQAEALPHSRTLVPYPLIPDFDIFEDNLGLAEITSASRPGHVAPRLTCRRHLGHVLLEYFRREFFIPADAADEKGYNEGVADVTTDYEKQVKQACNKVFTLGWMTLLKNDLHHFSLL